MFMTENALKNGIIRRVHVAVVAGLPLSVVFAGVNGEILVIMIPGGLVPIGSIMAFLAIGGKSCRLVVGIIGIIIIVLMTGIAIPGRAAVAVGMAIQALQADMRAGERKLSLIVIEGCRLPGSGAMAHVAFVAEIILHMVGIVRRGKIALMAGKTIGGQGSKLTVFVAAFADKGLMRPGQRKRG